MSTYEITFYARNDLTFGRDDDGNFTVTVNEGATPETIKIVDNGEGAAGSTFSGSTAVGDGAVEHGQEAYGESNGTSFNGDPIQPLAALPGHENPDDQVLAMGVGDPVHTVGYGFTYEPTPGQAVSFDYGSYDSSPSYDSSDLYVEGEADDVGPSGKDDDEDEDSSGPSGKDDDDEDSSGPSGKEDDDEDSSGPSGKVDDDEDSSGPSGKEDDDEDSSGPSGKDDDEDSSGPSGKDDDDEDSSGPSGKEDDEDSSGPSGKEDDDEDSSGPSGKEDDDEDSSGPSGKDDDDEDSSGPSGKDDDDEDSSGPSGKDDDDEDSSGPSGKDDDDEDSSGPSGKDDDDEGSSGPSGGGSGSSGPSGGGSGPSDPHCFTRGTAIRTARGEVLVEDLIIGDMVWTEGHGMQPIRWICQREVRAEGDFAPIRISAGTLSADRDILVSPAHRMLVQGPEVDVLFGVSKALVAAKDMVNGVTITRDTSQPMVEYFHILFDQHEVLQAHGTLSESFFPHTTAVEDFGGEQRKELFALFPELQFGAGSYSVAYPGLMSHEAALLGRQGY